MSSQFKNYYCLLIALFISTLCFSQKQFHVTIQFVPQLDTNNIEVWFDNGKGLGKFPVSVKNGKIEINTKVYSKYATVNLHSTVTLSQKTYFITKVKSSIIYYGNDKSNKDYPLANNKLVNATELTTCEEIKKLSAYTQKERKDVIDFNEKHKTELNTNDSLMSIYKQKEKKYHKKELDFIKLNSNQYFYLWYFNLGLKDTQDIEADSLLQFYKEVLYPKYKDHFEAKRTLDYLTTPPAERRQSTTDYYAINPLLKINQMAPDFTTTDISGRKLTLKHFRGKYVLLNFWATWCGPCVAELPLIKKLRDDFPEDQLEMISISDDRKQADLEKGIKQYGLNWTHIFKDEAFIKKYQISAGIPVTLLIDREGKIAYMLVGGLSDTNDLRKLMMN